MGNPIENIENIENDILDPDAEFVDSQQVEEVYDDIIVDQMDIGEEDDNDNENYNDNEDESRVLTFSQHKDSVYTVKFQPMNSSILVSGGGDDTAYLWNWESLSILAELEGHSDSVVDVGFSVDGKIVGTACLDGYLRTYDFETGCLLHKMEGSEEGFEWITWHPKGPVLMGGCGKNLWLFNGKNGEYLQSLMGHGEEVTSGCFSSDGKLVISGSADATVRIWAPKSGKTIHTLTGRGFHRAAINTLAVHPLQPLVLSASNDGMAILSNFDNGKILLRLAGHKDSIENVLYLPHDQGLAVTSSLDGTCRLWDLSRGIERNVFRHEEGIVKTLSCPLDSNIILSASVDSSVRLWDIRTATPVKYFQSHDAPILDCDFSFDGKVFATCSDDQSVNIHQI